MLLDDEMPYEQRIQLADEAIGLGVKTVDIVGAGELTLDPYFESYVDYLLDKGIFVTVFTNGAT